MQSSSSPTAAAAGSASSSSIPDLHFVIEGMTCAGCQNFCESTILKEFGDSISSVNVSFATCSGVVIPKESVFGGENDSYDEQGLIKLRDDIAVAVNASGFKCTALAIKKKKKNNSKQHQQEQGENVSSSFPSLVSIPDLNFVIEGMTCAGCQNFCESTILKNFSDYVSKVSVSFATCSGVVTPKKESLFAGSGRGGNYDENALIKLRDEIATAINSSGFKCTALAIKKKKKKMNRREDEEQARPLIVSSSCCSANSSTSTSAAAGQQHQEEEDYDDNYENENNDANDSEDDNGDDDDGDADEMEAENEITRRAIERTSEIEELTKTATVALLGGVPLLVIMFLMMTSPHDSATMRFFRIRVLGEMRYETLLGFLFATPVVFYSGRPFFTRAWKSVQIDPTKLGMDHLVSVGVLCAYSSSLIAAIYLMCCDSNSHTSSSIGTNFDTSGILLAFMTLGKLLEAKAKKSTGDSLLSLMQVVPKTCEKLTVVSSSCCSSASSSSSSSSSPQQQQDRKSTIVPTKTLRKGDLVRVLPGCSIPTDGLVVEGNSDVEEALVTGEPFPVKKTNNSTVIGGTNNLTAELVIRVTKTGKETVVAQILEIVKNAQLSKPTILRIADQIAAVFVPVVLILACLVMSIWTLAGALDLYPASWRTSTSNFTSTTITADQRVESTSSSTTTTMSPLSFAFNFMLATIVVSCPCALGLAAPTAIACGVGVGARLGILMKSAEAVERSNSVDVVIFDKTGTLTEGQMAVTHVEMFTYSESSKEETVNLVANVESRSVHPIAKAIVASSSSSSSDQSSSSSSSSSSTRQRLKKVYKMENWVQIPGKGVSAEFPGFRDNSHVAVGNLKYLQQEHGVKIDEAIEWQQNKKSSGSKMNNSKSSSSFSTSSTSAAETSKAMEVIVFAAVNKKLVAAIQLSDKIKSDAASTVAALLCLERKVEENNNNNNNNNSKKSRTAKNDSNNKNNTSKNIEVFIVTGDQREAALSVAEQVGLLSGSAGSAGGQEEYCYDDDDKYIKSQMLPRDKVEFVKHLQTNEGKRVMFVGDGVNDAAALSQADVGIAIGRGTNVAIDSADVVLIQDSLFNIVVLLDLARTIIQRIYINFAWSSIYNLVTLPVATGIIFFLIRHQLPPVVAGACMMVSSLSVVCSSLLLKLYVAPTPTSFFAGLRNNDGNNNKNQHLFLQHRRKSKRNRVVQFLDEKLNKATGGGGLTNNFGAGGGGITIGGAGEGEKDSFLEQAPSSIQMRTVH